MKYCSVFLPCLSLAGLGCQLLLSGSFAIAVFTPGLGTGPAAYSTLVGVSSSDSNLCYFRLIYKYRRKRPTSPGPGRSVKMALGKHVWEEFGEDHSWKSFFSYYHLPYREAVGEVGLIWYPGSYGSKRTFKYPGP